MGSIEKEIIQIVTNRLQRERDRSMLLNSLGSFMNNLTKKNKKYIKRIGFEKFIHNHPDRFAIVDERVYLLESSDIPPHLVNGETSNSSPQPVIENNQPKPPADSAIESIIMDLKKNPTCMVCSEEIEIYAYGLCFHAICYKCCTKMRVLCLDKQCPVCRADLPEVIFTNTPKEFGAFVLSNLNKEQKYGIHFDTRRIQNSYRQLLEHPCPKCNSRFEEFDRLKKHLKEKHGEYFCPICVKQCKKFTSERHSYSSEDLEIHQSEGDSGDGSAHKGHPLCEFCEQRYLDRDELYRHLRMNHITCKLCRNADNIFYMNLERLWDHYSESHYPCDAQDCYLIPSSVFSNEVDLQAHRVKCHPNMRNKMERKQEQQLHIPGMFNRQQSRGFEFTSPQKDSPIIHQPDGSIVCDGTVLGQHLNMFFGFIQPDGEGLSFNDNIFFNQQACNLDPEERLPNFFSGGDRVRVRAHRADNQRSKWRAITVEKITTTTAPLLPKRAYTISESSDMSSTSLHREEFPALESAGMSLPSTSSWNNIQKHMKPKYKASAVPTASSPSRATPTKKRTNSPGNSGICPDTGIGVVHHNLRNEFGFVVWQGAKEFCDNIYFHRMAYVEGLGGKGQCKSLLKDLPAGTKVQFKLDHSKGQVNGCKSKYRAQWVKRIEQTDENKENEKPHKSSEAKAHVKPPAEGEGKILNLSMDSGFLKWKDEVVIYFNKAAYLKGRGDVDMEKFDLRSELKPQTKVGYVMDSRPIPAGVAAKYKARSVWRIEDSNAAAAQNTRKHSETKDTGPSTSSVNVNGNGVPGQSRRKVSLEEMFKSAAVISSANQNHSNAKKEQAFTGFSQEQLQIMNGFSPNDSYYSTSDDGDFVYDSSDEDFRHYEHYDSESDGDIFGEPPYDLEKINSYTWRRNIALKSFYAIVGSISGQNSGKVHDVMESYEIEGRDCQFVQFSRRGPTQIFLAPELGRDGQSMELVQCDCSGFDKTAVEALIVQGKLSSIECNTNLSMRVVPGSAPNILHITGTFHFIILQRNAKGAVESLTVHNAF